LWQVVSSILAKLVADPATSSPVMHAVLSMMKLDIHRIREAAESSTN
jgi:predicted 3-demethylubiquinone-9 3-methyltransferase (glyoxalase superfamily)